MRDINGGDSALDEMQQGLAGFFEVWMAEDEAVPSVNKGGPVTLGLVLMIPHLIPAGTDRKPPLLDKYRP